MTYDASDTKAIRRAAKTAKQAERERQSVVLNLMSSPSGRSYVHARLVRCHVFSSSFTTDALKLAFNEGERNIGLQELNDVMAFAPDQYVQMMREANDRNLADERRSSGNGSGNTSDHGRADTGSESLGTTGAISDYDPGDALDADD